MTPRRPTLPFTFELTPRRRAALAYGAIGVGYAVVLLTVFYRVWWKKQFFGWDCLREYWPDIAFQIHALRDGELPLWNPYSLGGYPFHGDPQAGLLAPANWLCWFLSLFGGDGPWLIQVKVFVNMWVALTGMHLLVVRRTQSHAAAAVAAVLFLFGSPLLVHKNGALLWPFLYLPWAILALERFHERPTLRRGALLGAAVWLCGSAGHPQGFFYTLLVFSAYWTFLTLASPSPVPRAVWTELRRQGRGLAAFAVVAALLLLPIYVPSAQAVAVSPRADRGLEYVLQGGLPVTGLRELFVPTLDGNWQLDIYMGPLALVAALYALVAASTRRRRAERIMWAAVALFGVLLAMSRAGHVLPFFAERVPGFSLFRIAYRHKLIFGFAAALLAGDGIGAAVRGEGPKWARWTFVGLAGAWVIAALAIAAKSPALPLALGMLALCAAALFDARRARWYVAVLPLLALLDLWSAGVKGTNKIGLLQPPPDPKRDAPVLAQLEGVQRDWRYHVAANALPYHTPYLYEVREFSGFLNPITLKRQEDIAAQAKRAPQILAHFNVRYLLGGARPAGVGAWRQVPGSRAIELIAPAPLVRVYARAEALPAKDVLARLAHTDAARLAVALVEPADHPPGDLPHGGADAAPIDGVIARYARNRIDVDVTAPEGGGIAVLNEAWYPGWTAEVNGKATPVFRANYLLRAVVVPAGASHVTFRFSPRGYVPLLVLFALTLCAVGVLLVRREGAPPGPPGRPGSAD